MLYLISYQNINVSSKPYDYIVKSCNVDDFIDMLLKFFKSG